MQPWYSRMKTLPDIDLGIGRCTPDCRSIESLACFQCVNIIFWPSNYLQPAVSRYVDSTVFAQVLRRMGGRCTVPLPCTLMSEAVPRYP